MIMSVYEKTVNIFIHLLQTQPALFMDADKLELRKIIDSQPDEARSLSSAISDWCSDHPEVDEALSQLEGNNVGEKAPGSNQANPNIPQYQTDKQAIINAIQQSSSDGKDHDHKHGKSK